MGEEAKTGHSWSRERCLATQFSVEQISALTRAVTVWLLACSLESNNYMSRKIWKVVNTAFSW
jgi:hypothetical protein